MRDSFIFYRSFYEAIQNLEKKNKMLLYDAIARYSLDGILPTLKGAAKGMFLLIKPQIDANLKRYKNGTKGGRPITKPKPNRNQTVTKPEPNANVNVNDNVNDNVNVNGEKKPKLPGLFDQDDLEDEFNQAWALYPSRTGGNSKIAAYKAWITERQKGITVEELVRGVIRYQQYCATTEKINTKFVLTAKNFFVDQHYKNDWEIPDDSKSKKFDPAKQIVADLAACIERDKHTGPIR